jgi:predicted RNA-binding protein with PIN domain
MMTSKIIIDGWNVCWKIPAISALMPERLDRARTLLDQFVNNYYRNKKVQYKLFFDGQPGIINQTGKKQPKIQFSNSPETADELIIKFLKTQSRRKEWTVVTSDRHLAQLVKDLDAQTVTAEAFIQRINTMSGRNENSDMMEKPQTDNVDISYWLKKFNQGD